MIRLLQRSANTALSLRRTFSSLPVPLYQKSQAYLDSYDVNSLIVSSMTFPILVRKPDNLLVEKWFCERPFELTTDLLVPIINFKTGAYSGQCLRLDHEIFNLPLRRDIVHRVQVWESKFGKAHVHATKTLSTVNYVIIFRHQIQIEKFELKKVLVRLVLVEEWPLVDLVV